jgi:hypothetical protein
MMTYEIPPDNDTKHRHQIPVDPSSNPPVIFIRQDQSLGLESMTDWLNVGVDKTIRVLLVETIYFGWVHS